MLNSTPAEFNMSAKTIKCPKIQANHYFMQACETIIKPGNFRSWCKYCHHFQSLPEASQEQNNSEKMEDNC